MIGGGYYYYYYSGAGSFPARSREQPLWRRKMSGKSFRVSDGDWICPDKKYVNGLSGICYGVVI